MSIPRGEVPDDFNIHVSADGTVQSDAHQCGFRFPSDEINELLTLYGYNRCINGFDSNSSLEIYKEAAHLPPDEQLEFQTIV